MNDGDTMGSLFDDLDPVETTEHRDGYKETVEGYDTTVDVLGEAYVAWRHNRIPGEGQHTGFGRALERAADIEVAADELYRFCREEPLSGEDGLFVSALANTAPVECIYLPDMPGVDYLGKRNRDEIRLLGSAGEYLGHEMSGGTLTVRGDTGDHTGTQMRSGDLTVLGAAGDGVGTGVRGGEIRIAGSVGDDAGNSMEKGLLVIHGDAGANLGAGMDGGDIAVYGDVSGVGTESRSAKLYVDGEIHDTLHHDAPTLARKPWELNGIERRPRP